MLNFEATRESVRSNHDGNVFFSDSEETAHTVGRTDAGNGLFSCWLRKPLCVT